MKKVIALGISLIVSFWTPNKPDPDSYRDLGANTPKCIEKVFPYNQGRNCVSGKLENFTIKRLTDFGERPVWSPDGKKIAFVDKEFGDAYELDPATGETSCITCEFKHQGFLRVHYMKDGDYLLLGPKKFVHAIISRVFGTGFWWMPADRSTPPRWIGEKHFEGVAVSRHSRTIAYSKTWLSNPFSFPSKMYIAELSLDGKIKRKRVVATSGHIIEAQDFLPGDKGLIFARYTPEHEVFGVDFKTGKVTNYSQSPASEEPEGLFPDGRFTLMESDRHSRLPGEMDLDIYMLKLDGTGKDARRLTHFSDIPGEKASNPSVSPEGCRVAFMKAKQPEAELCFPSSDTIQTCEASLIVNTVSSFKLGKLTGAGDGIFLLEFFECREH